MCDPSGTWLDRFKSAYKNAFYRNSLVYCMALLTVDVILNLIPLARSHCG